MKQKQTKSFKSEQLIGWFYLPWLNEVNQIDETSVCIDTA